MKARILFLFLLSFLMVGNSFGQIVDKAKATLTWGLLTSPVEPSISVSFVGGSYNYIYNDEVAWIRVKNNFNDELRVKLRVTVTSQCGKAETFYFDKTLKGYQTLEASHRFEDASCKKFREFGKESREKSKISTVSSAELLEFRNLTKEKAAKEKLAAEKKAALEKKQAEEKAKQGKGAKTTTSQTNSSQKGSSSSNSTSESTGDDDFWETGSKTTKSNNSTTSSSSQKPQYVKGTDGRYYRKQGNTYQEVSYDAYMAAKYNETQQKQQAATQQKQQQVNETLDRIEKHNQNRQARIERTNLAVDQAVSNTQNLIMDTRAQNQTERALRANSSLSGNYRSVDELMADFNRRMANVNQLSSNLKTQHERRVHNMANAYWGGSSSTDVALNQGAKLLGTIAGNAHAKKQEREARERLEREKAAQLRKLQAERKQMLTGVRTDLFARFKEGALPLSSTKVPVDVIYYFVYAYDPAQIGTEQPQLYVSNVFPVSRYSDGTWPFKTSITKEIGKLTPLGEVLHGYYTSQGEAEAMRQGLVDVFQKTGGITKAISYKGKVSSSSGSSGDFWETGGKASQKEQKKEADDDFWETGKKTTPLTKKKTEKKTEKENDFWNN